MNRRKCIEFIYIQVYDNSVTFAEIARPYFATMKQKRIIIYVRTVKDIDRAEKLKERGYNVRPYGVTSLICTK